MARFYALLFGLLAACSSLPQPPPTTLRVACSQFPTTLDPQKSGDFISSTLICLAYDGLTRCLPDGSVEPAVAEWVEMSEDQTVYTFHLRDTVWSDGHPVTAFDFERSWKQAVNPGTASLCAYLFYPIRGAKAVAQGTLPIDELGVVALDAHTLEVQLERPTPHFLSLTAFPSFLPSPKSCGNVTNGPFLIQQIAPHTRIFLSKNPRFWNAKNIALDAIEIHIIPEIMTALKMFELGELDWIGGGLSSIPADAFEELKASGRLSFYPIAASTICTFNTHEWPFHNVHMRKAFDLAINRTEIVTHLLHGSHLEAKSVVPPVLWDAKREDAPSLFDPEQARWHFQRGCEELGISELEPITLSVRTSDNDRLLSQILQLQWQEALGVQVKIQRTDTKSLKMMLHQRGYQVALTNWIAQYPDPLNILERFVDKEHAKNYPAWENPEFNEKLAQALNIQDPVRRSEFLAYAEEILAGDSAIAPIYHWKAPSLCHPRVHNVATTPSGGILFERVYLSND